MTGWPVSLLQLFLRKYSPVLSRVSAETNTTVPAVVMVVSAPQSEAAIQSVSLPLMTEALLDTFEVILRATLEKRPWGNSVEITLALIDTLVQFLVKKVIKIVFHLLCD